MASKVGTVGWLVICGFVTVWDLKAKESLSHAFMRAPHIAKICVWTILTAHLFGKLPHKIDPFYIALERSHGRTRRQA